MKPIDRMIHMLSNLDDVNSYFVRFIDVFFSLPEVHQVSLIAHIVEDVGTTRWEKIADDVYQYPALVRMILYHYSSIDSSVMSKDPTPSDLASLIKEYKSSVTYRDNEKIAGDSKGSDEFLNALEA